MAHVLFLLIIAVFVAGVAYGFTALVTGRDAGLVDTEPDGRAVPLPTTRPLVEADMETVRFDTTMRGYRMDQVDLALRRAAYDIGYKGELINVLEAEIAALRDGRVDDAETLRRARIGAQAGVTAARPDGPATEATTAEATAAQAAATETATAAAAEAAAMAAAARRAAADTPTAEGPAMTREFDALGADKAPAATNSTAAPDGAAATAGTADTGVTAGTGDTGVTAGIDASDDADAPAVGR